MEAQPWYQSAVFYEVYVRAFYDSNADGHGDLNGLAQKLDYLKSLGVDCLWLLPIYPSPLKDDGYDISAYNDVHPDYGSLEDFKRLLEAAHRRGMRVVTDLVMNHTSDQHPWFQAARADRNSPYRDYYVWSDTDRKYKDTRIIFLDTEKSNWTWDPLAGQFFWHRFYASQPDLNYDNPRVQEEMLKVMDFWLDLGVDGFRADAVPYLFEREGTDCENLPETHAYLKRVRRHMDEKYPGRVLLCEANQWPRDVRPYFGDGDEFNLAFHFPLMPRIFMAIKQGDRTPIAWALEQTPAIPEGCQWVTFLRNHDELTLEMVTPEERRWMWERYAREPRMRQNLGIRRRLAPLLDNDRRKIELAFSLLFTLPGAPILYYGDEIGMGDNIWLEDRNGLRTPMQWDATPGAGFSSAGRTYAPVIGETPFAPDSVNVAGQLADPASLWHTLRKMIALRKAHAPLRAGDFAWLEVGAKAILAASRRAEGEHILVVHNLGNRPETCDCPVGAEADRAFDLLAGTSIPVRGGQLSITLQPYQYLWLSVPSGGK
jgi:maltose alpha-D-glucosyltransferase/alpha-amylase